MPRCSTSRLRPHHVADGNKRKIQAPGLAGFRIDFGRAGRSHAAADDIGADDKEAVGIDRLARPHHGRPPAGFAGDGMVGRHELVAGQGMTDQDGIALVRVQRAIGRVGDRERRKLAAAVQRQRRLEGDGHSDIRRWRGHRAQETRGLGHPKSLKVVAKAASA